MQCGELRTGCQYWKRESEWAEEYFASSVSEENLDRVRLYIHHQEEHHQKISFLDEYNDLLKHFGISDGEG